MCDGPDLFLCILAVLFPPIAVWVKRGVCSADSLINIALCMLGYLPGLIHAWYVVSTYPDPGYESVPQEGEAHVVYYVHTQPPAGGYGTVQPHGQFPGQQGATANAFKPKTGKKSNARSQPPIPQPSAAPSAENRAGEGSSANSDLPPPTYADAVKADNKVQH